MEEEEKGKKGGINLDWDRLFSSDEKAEPPELEIKKKRKIVEVQGDDDDEDQNLAERFRGIPDRELVERMERLKRTSEALPLCDGGEKCRISIKRHEAELERRRLLNSQKDDEKCKELFHYVSCSGKFDGSQKETPVQENSLFSRYFLQKMEPNAHGPFKTTLNNCDSQKMKSNGHNSSAGRHKLDSSSRQTPFRCPSTLSTNSDTDIVKEYDKAACPVSASVYQSKEESSKMRSSSHVRPSHDLRRRSTVVLVDEDEVEITEADQQIVGVDECKKDARIYYPSRDDAESVEIRYSDLDCLASEAYLTSTIINFYIRYLQQHIYLISKEGEDFHFFNTYFYEKLREAMLNKNDMEASFTKIRRWWKGVKLFEKAYIFLPIHENYHWSLVIICIPDKEDGSGPSVIHLDSLGLHSSKSIFEKIKRFLSCEWQFLTKDGALPDPPFPVNICERFPRRINVNAIEVPQQSNEYDCGLFVLSFIEQFIEKAPRRMKKDDLTMLGKTWFKPVKASLLREKIHHLLKNEFNKEKQENCLPDA